MNRLRVEPQDAIKLVYTTKPHTNARQLSCRHR